MSFFFKLTNDNFSYNNDELEEYIEGGVLIFSKGFSKKEIPTLAEAFKVGTISKKLNSHTTDVYAIFIYDKNNKEIFAANDKFGSYEIFISKDKDNFVISNNIKSIFLDRKTEPEIEMRSVYELISFYAISPPRTIYKGITALPMASCFNYSVEKRNLEIERYWEIEKLFKSKETEYKKVVEGVRNSLVDCVSLYKEKNTGVAVSGGIDSGGILGIFSKVKNKPVKSISIGPRGPETLDLKSARKTVQHTNSENYEIYPKVKEISKLKYFVSELNQPIASDLLFPNSLVFEKAEEISLDSIMNGSGAEMLLGNLKISKIAFYLEKIEKIVPRAIRNPLYKVVGKVKGLSKNQIEFLLARSWPERFLHTRGSLFSREKKYFKNLPDDFLDVFIKDIEKLFDIKKINLLDKLTLVYMFGWTNYLQMRDFTAMGKRYGVCPIMPFDTLRVASALFKTPNKFRRKNNWNKQVIRDALRPYVSEDLYNNKVRSLIVPYTEWFEYSHSEFIKYLRTSKIISETINLDKYEKEYNTLPEPGLSLMRLLGVAIWYDVNWNPRNVENFDKAVKKL